MGKEIERKFLVVDNSFLECAESFEEICQGYLSTTPESTVRVRIKGNKAFITVKSKTIGITRGEWEYEIPVNEARELLSLCSGSIEKTRYYCGRWEIDIFHGKLSGLILAEIELNSENEAIKLPSFIDREVTNDKRYFNSVLSEQGLPSD